MRLLRRLYRLARLLPHIVRGIFQAATRLPSRPPPRNEAEWETVRAWARSALARIGVDLRIHGTPVRGPALVVSNHVSWLDIGALLTIVDAGFIGKQELASWPVLGYLISKGGTIYIERGGRGAAARATEEMARRLQRGERAAVFPEGTTSRIGEMRRFHPRLFEAARSAGVPVQPVALVYDNARVPFVDDDAFVTHLWRLLGERSVRVDVHLLPPIEPAGLDRRTIATRAEAAVREVATGQAAVSAATTAPTSGPHGGHHHADGEERGTGDDHGGTGRRIPQE
jgi:1-acyl-sn-glycerol-3-phosphate acyltransferase